MTSPTRIGIILVDKNKNALSYERAQKGEATMAIIAGSLFGWQEVNAKSDSKRLKLVLQSLPDEELMRHLEEEREKVCLQLV